MASGHALDLAASTAALCLLVGRLRGAPQLGRLQINMLTAIEDGGGGPAQQPMAARHAALEMRVLRSLKETMADNASLRCATLSSCTFHTCMGPRSTTSLAACCARDVGAARTEGSNG